MDISGNGNTFEGNTRREISLHPSGWRKIFAGVKIHEIFNPVVHAPYGNPDIKIQNPKKSGNGNACNGKTLMRLAGIYLWIPGSLHTSDKDWTTYSVGIPGYIYLWRPTWTSAVQRLDRACWYVSQ